MQQKFLGKNVEFDKKSPGKSVIGQSGGRYTLIRGYKSFSEILQTICKTCIKKVDRKGYYLYNSKAVNNSAWYFKLCLV